MQCFKDSNREFLSTQVVVIDKDFAEWRMLKEEFPNSVVLFCQWHVLKVFFKQLADAGVERAQRDTARTAIRSVMYAKDEEEYEVEKQEIFDSTNAEFKRYFLVNWETCVQMWAAFMRDQYLHLEIQLIADSNLTTKS